MIRRMRCVDAARGLQRTQSILRSSQAKTLQCHLRCQFQSSQVPIIASDPAMCWLILVSATWAMAVPSLSSPLSVDVVPSGYSDSKDIVNLVFTVLTFLATTAIPVLIWLYGRRQDNARQQQEARQRLQMHVARLSDTNAMNVISTFKQDCGDLQPPLNYGTVFKQGKMVKDTSSGITIKRQQIQQVDTARKKLQGIWDNIIDDYRAKQLGGYIFDSQHSRILKRGLSYMKLVEPLEAANWVRLGSADNTVAQQGDYVLSTNGSCLMQMMKPIVPASVVVTVPDGLPTRAPSPTARSTTPAKTTGSTAPAPQEVTASTAPDDQAFAVFNEGARPSRFRWLEDQKTIKIVGMPFWQDKPQKCKISVGGREVKVRTRIPIEEAYQLLRDHEEGKQWLKEMRAHWQTVCDAHEAAKSGPLVAART